MLEQPAFLNVARSATGRRWVGPSAETERLGLAIAQATGEPEIVARVLAGRGVLPETAEAYLAPTLRDLMPDPSTLAGMDTAAARLADAAARGERVALFGDYDVDGAASVALVADWLAAFGIVPAIHVPDRVAEGYGPNAPAMEALAARASLILCLDCGTMGHGPIAAARAKGADVLVLDHHLPGPTLPEALAVVNPNRPDCASGQGHLCAAGVAFLTLVAAQRELRRRRAFAGRAEPDLREGLDLVALATVADVAPLRGLNRAFVRQGLAVMARRGRPGLAALADAARLTAPPSSRDLGFALGPRINAGGRIGSAGLGARLLGTRCPEEAARIAATLEDLNRRRRDIEAGVTDAAIAQIEARGADAPLAWAAGEGWHPGVVGIVASRLKERYDRPALVIGLDGGTGTGSGRSVEGVDLGSAVATLADEGLLLKGGGHAMAAGLTIAADGVAPAMQELSRRLAAAGAGARGPADLILDGALAPRGATAELCDALEAAGPYGPANPAPRIAVPAARVAALRWVGTGHAQVRLADKGANLDAIAFRAEGTPLGDALARAAETGRPLHAAGRIARDDWGGRRRAKLQIEDVAIA